MPKKIPLYVQAVEVCNDYLGPASERFLRRQVTTHLRVKPENLTHAHLSELVDWVRIAFSLLTDDEDLVEEFTQRLTSLSNIDKKSINSNRSNNLTNLNNSKLARNGHSH